MTTDPGLSPLRIEQAITHIDPEFLNSPQYEDVTLNKALGRRVLLKVETCNPIRSFKARGVSVALSGCSNVDTVVCASSGNFGQAVAYVGRSRGLSVRVFVPATINPAKRDRIEALGASITTLPNLERARETARSAGAVPRTLVLEDGVPPAIAEGAGTIAIELGAAGPVDAVAVPIGDGSLIAGIGCWLRHRQPATRIVGINPASAPSMYRSWRAGKPVRVEITDTFAEGISVPTPHAESLRRVSRLVDDIVLVDTAEIAYAITVAERHLGIRLEPAGASALAAIARGRIRGDRVAAILTGANPNPQLHETLAKATRGVPV
jgi:threonine dehydratase